ncbi:MAG: hypothetical protein L0Y32_04770 [Nevskiales bacterium]|nr:hypothetical protein [Nevskiales bacterium]
MKNIFAVLAALLLSMAVGVPAFADSVEKEHEKAKGGDYKEELEESIQKHGGERLKEEDKKHHEKEAEKTRHEENYRVRKSGDTTEHQKR